MSGLRNRITRGISRGFQAMETTIEEAAGDIEMGLVGIEEAAVADITPLISDVGLVAVAEDIALVGAEALNPLAVAGFLGSEFLSIIMDNGRRRKVRNVTTERAPARSSAPALPNTRPKDPRRAGPDRRNFGPTAIVPGSNMPAKRKSSGRKSVKDAKRVKRAPGKRTVKKKSSKKKPKKKATNYSTSIKQEVHGVMKRKSVSYFGFQATGGANELFSIAADALLRAVLKKHKVGIRRTDEVVATESAVPVMTKVQFYYRRTKYEDGTNDAGGGDGTGYGSGGTAINFAVGTYESHVQALATELNTKVRDGYYPYYFATLAAAGNIVSFSRKVGDAKLNLSVKRTIKLRNITKSDGGDEDTNALDTNPLQGRLYKFRHDVPRVGTALYETDPNAFAKFHDRLCTAGVIFGPQRKAGADGVGSSLVDPTGIMGESKVLSSPPPGGRVWDNLSSSKKIGLAPGQAAKHTMAFKFAGTFRQFLSKFAASDYTAPSIGYCHMFGFEQKFKTSQNDIINVEYDCDDVLKGGCTFVREDVTPPTVRTLHGHSSTYD